MHIWHLFQISHLQTVWINLFLTFFGSLYNLFSVIKSGGTPFCKALLRKVSAKLLNALPKILHATWTKKTQLFNGLMEMYSTSNQWRHLLKLFGVCTVFYLLQSWVEVDEEQKPWEIIVLYLCRVSNDLPLNLKIHI